MARCRILHFRTFCGNVGTLDSMNSNIRHFFNRGIDACVWFENSDWSFLVFSIGPQLAYDFLVPCRRCLRGSPEPNLIGVRPTNVAVPQDRVRKLLKFLCCWQWGYCWILNSILGVLLDFEFLDLNEKSPIYIERRSQNKPQSYSIRMHMLQQ